MKIWAVLLKRKLDASAEGINLFNSLPNHKLLDWSKFKVLANNKINFAKMMISIFDTVKNIVGKGENAGNQHFLLFRQCFQQAPFSGSLKVGLCVKELSLKTPYWLIPDVVLLGCMSKHLMTNWAVLIHSYVMTYLVSCILCGTLTPFAR